MDDTAPRRLLVWDAPNIDVALGTLLGGRAPRPEERPRFDALARWLVERTPPEGAWLPARRGLREIHGVN